MVKPNADIGHGPRARSLLRSLLVALAVAVAWVGGGMASTSSTTPAAATQRVVRWNDASSDGLLRPPPLSSSHTKPGVPLRRAHYAGRDLSHLRSSLKHYAEGCFHVAAYQWICPLPAP